MDPRIVYRARSNAEASIVKSWLEEEGLDANIFNGEMAGGAFEIIESDPVVVVNADDFDRAQEVVENFRKELEQPSDMAVVTDAEGQFDWPTCPICDELRYARCVQCQTLGSEFSTDEEDQITCLACNQITQIAFVEKCQFCGHDYSEDQQAQMTPLNQSIESGNANRILLLAGGLVILFIVLMIWFGLAMG